MAKYRVHFMTAASTSVEVEADSREEAVDVAFNEVHVSLCHQCAREVDLGEFELPSALFPGINNAEDDVQEIED